MRLSPYASLMVLLALTACDDPSKSTAPSANPSSAPAPVKTVKSEIPDSHMTLESTAFKAGGAIPKKYTCEGANVSPALKWTQLPPQTRSLVMIIDDPDAPDPAAPKMTWTHWVVFGLAPDREGLDEGVKLNRDKHVAWNDFRHRKYEGPCPPKGKHRYFHKLYALDIEIRDRINPSKSDIEQLMKGHILGKAELIGTYEKQAK
jgi:Raf kinase inhibitor-like YbhB/YbcL family protein